MSNGHKSEPEDFINLEPSGDFEADIIVACLIHHCAEGLVFGGHRFESLVFAISAYCHKMLAGRFVGKTLAGCGCIDIDCSFRPIVAVKLGVELNDLVCLCVKLRSDEHVILSRRTGDMEVGIRITGVDSRNVLSAD